MAAKELSYQKHTTKCVEPRPKVTGYQEWRQRVTSAVSEFLLPSPDLANLVADYLYNSNLIYLSHVYRERLAYLRARAIPQGVSILMRIMDDSAHFGWGVGSYILPFHKNCLCYVDQYKRDEVIEAILREAKMRHGCLAHGEDCKVFHILHSYDYVEFRVYTEEHFAASAAFLKESSP